MPNLTQNFNTVVSRFTEMGLAIESNAEDFSRAVLQFKKIPGQEVPNPRVCIEVAIEESLDKCTVTPFYQRGKIRAQIGPINWDNPTILNWIHLLDIYLGSGFFEETSWLELI